jgi:hypothetical protein
MIIHLREALSTLFPEYEKVFRQLDSAGSLALLAAYPGPEHIIVAVGRKLLSALYAMLKSGMAYDPNWEVNSRPALARH